MSFVFVSHASPDKPLIRHIVEALIADGHKIWLDNPAAMGYSVDDIQRHFFRLHAGGRWLDEIEEAIREAPAVLVCFSKRYNEARDVWHDEAAAARTLGKLVACRIDDVDPQSLRNQYSAQQMPDLRPSLAETDRNRALELLVEDVRRMLDRANKIGLSDRRITQFRDPGAPYLINRTRHEELIGDVIEISDRNSAIHAFIVAGPENECVDEFISRLKNSTCLDRLKGRSWLSIEVEWFFEQRGPAFIKTYLRRCARELGLPAHADEAAIVQGLAGKGKPVAVVSRMMASQWQADEHERLHDWLALWNRLAAQPQRICAWPLLALKFPPAKTPWRDCPGGQAPDAVLPNAAIWRAVQALRGGRKTWTAWRQPPSAERAPIEIPPLLHPVSRTDADHWLARPDVAGQLGRDCDEARTRIKTIFNGVSALAVETFADTMKPLFHPSLAPK